MMEGDVKENVSTWEVSDLLSDEAVLGETSIIHTNNGFRHIFISTKSSFISQALYISRHIDHLLFNYYNSSQNVLTNHLELWLHGIGNLAITRTIELALHINHRMYPGQLNIFTYTSSCSSNKQVKFY